MIAQFVRFAFSRPDKTLRLRLGVLGYPTFSLRNGTLEVDVPAAFVNRFTTEFTNLYEFAPVRWCE